MVFYQNRAGSSMYGGKCGFIDQTGKEVISFIYDDARYFNKDGKAKVRLNGETFFIDVKGNRVE